MVCFLKYLPNLVCHCYHSNLFLLDPPKHLHVPYLCAWAMSLNFCRNVIDSVQSICCLLFSRSVTSDSLWPRGPGFFVLHYHLELVQTHVHWVGDAIQPSYPLSSPSPPALNLSQHQGLSSESTLCIRWLKCWSFSILNRSSSSFTSLICIQCLQFLFESLHSSVLNNINSVLTFIVFIVVICFRVLDRTFWISRSWVLMWG